MTGIYPPALALLCVVDAGKPYLPSNGTEGDCFIYSWCGNCARDKPCSEGKPFDECADDEVCKILSDAFAGEVKEWIYGPDGQPVCTAFVPAGEQTPPPRCEHTADMFEEAEA